MFDTFSAWTQQIHLLALLTAENGQPLWEVRDEAPADSSDSRRGSVRASARQRPSRSARRSSRS
jgi:hypothetical protein